MAIPLPPISHSPSVCPGQALPQPSGQPGCALRFAFFYLPCPVTTSSQSLGRNSLYTVPSTRTPGGGDSVPLWASSPASSQPLPHPSASPLLDPQHGGCDGSQREQTCTAFGSFLAGFRVEISHAHTYQFSLLIWSPKPGVSMTVSFILTPPSSITGELTEKAPKRSLFRVMPGSPLPTSQGDPGSFLLQDQLLEKSSSGSSPPQHLCSCCSLYLEYLPYFFLPV